MKVTRIGGLELYLPEHHARISFERDLFLGSAWKERFIRVTIGSRTNCFSYSLGVEGAKWRCYIFLNDATNWSVKGVSGIVSSPLPDDQLRLLIRDALFTLQFEVQFVTDEEAAPENAHLSKMALSLHPAGTNAPKFEKLGQWQVVDASDGTEVLFIRMEHPLSPGFKLWGVIYRLGDKYLVLWSDLTDSDFSNTVQLSIPQVLSWEPYDIYDTRAHPERSVVRMKLEAALALLGLTPVFTESTTP